MKIIIIFLAVSVMTAFASHAASSEGIPHERVAVKLEVPAKFRKGPFSPARTLKAPPGFKVSVFAAGLKGPRFMALDENGDLYVSLTSEGKIVVLPDRDRDGVADEVKVFAEGLERPHGLALRGDGLIAAETGRLILLRKGTGPKAGKTEVISEDIPSGGGHFTRTVAEGAGGSLYVSAGSSCNVCVEDDRRRAAVLKFTGQKAEVFATGLRNSVGLAFHPDTGELWGVDNGRDLLGDDMPPEELNRIVKGGDYGWPYCYGNRIPDPEYGSKRRCAGTVPPAVEMQAHSAPLGIAFGKGLGFPDEYREALFIAFHGSWNRSVPTGYKLVAVPFREGKPAGGPVDIITGWMDEGGVWGRPVDPVVGRDGALYISDDYAGAIYRVTAGQGLFKSR